MSQGTLCRFCPTGRFAGVGATACDTCVGTTESGSSNSGFVLLPVTGKGGQVIFDGLTGDCAPCIGKLQGLDCREDGRTLVTAPLRQGYWRASILSHYTIQCPQKRFCPGLTLPMSANLSLGNMSSNLSLASWTMTSPCVQNHKGPYCLVYYCLGVW